jgi:hypothetical protein
VICLFKARTVEPEETAVARTDSTNMLPWQPNHVTAARDTHTIIGELLEVVFSK